ncbi:MAG: hypothetical protein JEZ09_15550 [Salinivirgaceae bacterium]|nr:hypothetical protein [Salinivirgaceae bacterium]
MKKIITTSFFLLVGLFLFSQNEVDVEREFIYRGKHYIPHSPYWTVGTGYGYNFDEAVVEPNLFVDLHYRLFKEHYFGTGFLLSRNQILAKGYDNIFLTHDYLKHSVINAHVTYGWRGVGLKYNWGVFVGPSLNWGFDYAYTDTAGNYFVNPFLEPGLFVSGEITYKYFFDMGIGLTAWASVNKSYQAAGISLHLYFSAALKRTLAGY